MSAIGKIDLGTNFDTKIDAMLKGWPAPGRDDAAWEAKGKAIVDAALAAPKPDAGAIAGLIEAPRLNPEPGEKDGVIPPASEVRMKSEGANSGAPSGPASAAPAASEPRKKMSLKELAERASQSGASSRPSVSSTATPLPVAARPSTVTPLPVPAARATAPSVPPRPAEAGKEDSGIVDLKTIHESATAQQIAAAEKAQPAAHDLMADAEGEGAPAKPTGSKVVPLKQSEKKKGSGGAIAGGLIALLGIAAAFAIVQMNKKDEPQRTTTQIAAENQPQAGGAAKPGTPEEPQAAPVNTLAQAEQGPAQEPEKKVEGQEQVAALAATGSPGSASTEPAKQGGASAEGEKVAATSPPAAGGAKPKDLASAMQQAVGEQDKPGAGSGEPVPAAGGTMSGNSSVPEQPSQGAALAAIGSVMGGAKVCVAGADNVSRAQVTFASNGQVTNVVVTGWAAENGKADCVKRALKGAKVGPFSKPSFTVGIPIRP